jgi:tungstate transport system substrate-binding protein
MVKTLALSFLLTPLMLSSFLRRRGAARPILLASTIGPIEAGIVQALEDGFEGETGIRVRHVGAGTGAALDIARQGEVDLVLVHAKALEEEFVKEGFGTDRIDLMYNDFVIVGPANDPAGLKTAANVIAALKKIAERQVSFVSRGDNSGTHVAEKALWKKAGISPSDAWYEVYERGAEGNGPTLLHADERDAYTLIDRSTYLIMKDRIHLIVLVENDEVLRNYMTLIPVNPTRFPRVSYENAMRFVGWLTNPEKGQLVIRDFGKETFGGPLFFPNSKEWKASQMGSM